MTNKSIKITDDFWTKYRKLVKKEMIPYQWQVLNDAIGVNIEKERNDSFIPNEKSHAIENFKIAAGLAKGEHYGWVFQDSDVYKWLEAVAYSLREYPDDDLKTLADGVVELISKAQEPDGYLDTYFTIKAPNRKFKRLGESHELYCAGHFLEAAVAYYETTGNELVLEVAEKLANCINENFGPEENKIHGYDGHEEIEIGLMKLFHLTGNENWLKLANYFILERGKNPDYFRQQKASDVADDIIPGMGNFPDSYFQNHKPVYEQDTAEGHAVRLVYMCTAMADIAKNTGDKKLLTACKNIWQNIVTRRLYVTGGIGSTVIGESFTLDYDLPNDTMYCETCAAIGLVFFANKMLNIEADSKYADVMERALYNSVISGMALDGKHFFYVNPLEVNPKKLKFDPTKSHVKPIRPQWLGCACCPPNLARLITSVEDYIYSQVDGKILVNLFIQSEFDAEGFLIKQKTDYPYDGKVEILTENNSGSIREIGIRIPNWATSYDIKINGLSSELKPVNGYVFIKSDDKSINISIDFKMEVRTIFSNLNVSEDVGKVAIQRGPFIYCTEEIDNGSGLHCLYLDDQSFDVKWEANLLGGVNVITAKGKRLKTEDGQLYSYSLNLRESSQDIKFIPYYSWANRGENEMRVWINFKN